MTEETAHPPWWRNRLFVAGWISTLLLVGVWVHSLRWALHLSVGGISETTILLSSHGQVGLLYVPPRHPAHAIVVNGGKPMSGACGEIAGPPVWYYLASLCPAFGQQVGWGLESTHDAMDYWGLKSEEYLGWPVARREIQVPWLAIALGWTAIWAGALKWRFRTVRARRATLETTALRSEPVEF